MKKQVPIDTEPYQLLDSGFISEEIKQQLRARYRVLNPAQLKRQIESLQRKLQAPALRTSKPRKGQHAKRHAPKPAAAGHI